MAKNYYLAIHNLSHYELTPETQISENLCWFVRNLNHPNCSPLRELLGNNSLAIRGNTYRKDIKNTIVLAEVTEMNTEDVMAMLFGLQYSTETASFQTDPKAAPFYSNRNLLVEIANRWHKGTVIWCEKAGRNSEPLAHYIKSAKNPAIFPGARQEIIVVSDETSRPGDIIVRMYPQSNN